MPIFDWQSVVALACVAIAVAVIVRRVWSFLHPVGNHCGGGCVGCGSHGKAADAGLVSLSLPQSREAAREETHRS